MPGSYLVGLGIRDPLATKVICVWLWHNPLWFWKGPEKKPELPPGSEHPWKGVISDLCKLMTAVSWTIPSDKATPAPTRLSESTTGKDRFIALLRQLVLLHKTQISFLFSFVQLPALLVTCVVVWRHQSLLGFFEKRKASLKGFFACLRVSGCLQTESFLSSQWLHRFQVSELSGPGLRNVASFPIFWISILWQVVRPHWNRIWTQTKTIETKTRRSIKEKLQNRPFVFKYDQGKVNKPPV